MSCTQQGPKTYCKMRKLRKTTTSPTSSTLETFTTSQLTKTQQLQIKGQDGIIVTDDLVIG